MSNDDVGKTEHTLDIDIPHVIEVPHVNKRVRQYFKMHPKIERNLLVSLILVSVSLDPLFFYISVVNNNLNCLGLDNSLRIIVVVLRTFVDGLYIILWFHKLAFLPQKPCRRILSWIVAILAILPLPQVVVYAVSWRLLTVKLLKFIVLIQFVPKVYLIIPSYQYARNRSYESINFWAAAAFYLFMFILASNVLGAFWYLRAIERNIDCWKKACKIRGLCGVSSLYCDDNLSNNKYLEEFCPIPPLPNSTFFDHGIYLDAFERDIIGSRTNFLDKLFHCFWWGLQSLSSFGQNLKPGTYIWDNFFAAFIVIAGLILVALLIGNMQVYLQKRTTTELDKDQMKRIRKSQIDMELKCWPPFYKLPRNLREEVILCNDDKWLGTTEINVESLLKNTPLRLRKDLKLYLCKDLFSKYNLSKMKSSLTIDIEGLTFRAMLKYYVKVKMFEELAPEVKKQLRIRAKPVVFQAKTIIHEKGNPIHEMIHIVQGKVMAFDKDISKKEGLPCHVGNLTKNDSFGKELLCKAFESTLPNLPIAPVTVQSLTKVEAFVLSDDDIADLLNRHGYLSRSNREDWAANVITNAIRRKAALRMVVEPSLGK